MIDARKRPLYATEERCFLCGPSDRTVRNNVKFEVFTAVTTKNAVFWDVTPCGSYKYSFSACFGC
jgi:hypothetical protein